MKKLIAAMLALYAPAALAQSNPGFLNGNVLTGVSLSAAFATKADATNGVLNNPTLNGTVSGTGITALLAPYAPLANPTFTGTLAGAAAAFGGSLSSATMQSTAFANISGNTINKGTCPDLTQCHSYYTGANLTGAPVSGDAYLINYTVSSDSMDTTGLGSGQGGILALIGNIGGSNFRGSRNQLLTQMSLSTATPASTNLGAQLTGHAIWLFATANAGGTALGTGTTGGYWYGLNPQIVFGSAATFYTLANVWGEGDLNLQAGSSVLNVLGRSTILESTHAVGGLEQNIVDLVGAQVGAVPTWVNGYAFGGIDGIWPMASAATLLGTVPQRVCGGSNKSCRQPAEAATFGVDWGMVNFSLQSGFAYRSAGFSVDGTGTATLAGLLTAAPSATGGSIDIPKAQVVTSLAVATAGTASGNGQNNYYPGDIVMGTGSPTSGQYQVTHTKAIAATVNAGGSGGTSGACTVTGTTGTGTKFQASGTVTGGALSGALTIAVAGDYTVNPTAVAQEPVTGCGLTGAKVNVGVGVLTTSILAPDVFASCPASITPTLGSGVGLVLTPTCSARGTLGLQASGGALQGGSGMFTANGSVGTTMTSLGPSGAHTTVQEWLTITDAGGTVRYIPAY